MFVESLAVGFQSAMLAILGRKSSGPVDKFFRQIRDFKGANNRYGQLAVSDFLEFLAIRLPDIFSFLKSRITMKLQCLTCKWLSLTTSCDLLVKLYIPPGEAKRISLTDLLTYNFSSTLAESATNCGKCRKKTTQKSTPEQVPLLLCFEIIRVTQKVINSRHSWTKNNIRVTFPTRGISVPGSVHKYRVIGTSHHKGTLLGGHWFTKVCTKNNQWFDLDDLRFGNHASSGPGSEDNSVVILILLAEHVLS